MQEIVLREGETLTPLKLDEGGIVVLRVRESGNDRAESAAEALRQAGHKGILIVLRRDETLEVVRDRLLEELQARQD